MDAQIPTPKRRTSSYNEVFGLAPVIPEAEPVPPQALDEVPVQAIRPRRFRRASFALSGERKNVIDELVDSASQSATQAAATREALAICASVSPPPEQRRDSVGSEHTPRLSVATLVPGFRSNTDSTFSDSSIDNRSRKVSLRGNITSNGIDANERIPVWSNEASSESNPLHSVLVQRYLATLASDSTVPRDASPPKVISPSSHVGDMAENIPGLIQLISAPMASMTMPVQQIRRAHAEQARKFSVPSADSHLTVPNPGYSRRPLTDASDTETWDTTYANALGYVSDNHLMDARQLRLAGKRLEADYHRSTTSLPRSQKRIRNNAESRGSPALMVYETPTSTISSRFNLTHVYDGLGSPLSSRNSSLQASTASLNLDVPHLVAPHSTPGSSQGTHQGSPSSANQLSLQSGNGLNRLRSLLDQLKPEVPPDDTETYIYMDEKTRARRAEAQAANVMSPVSF